MVLIENRNKEACVIDDKVITYGELIKNIKQLSSIVDIKENSHVMIFMENRVEYVYSIFATFDKKAVNVCIDSSANFDELYYFVENSDSELIFTSNANISLTKSVVEKLNKDIKIINVDEIKFGNFEYDGELKIEIDDVYRTAFILYTSGTTGNPKGVMLTFDNILFNIEALDKYKMFEEVDKFIVLLPLHHTFPLLGTVFVPIYVGATLVFLKDFSSQAIMDTMKKHKVTIMVGVPKIWELIHKKIKEKVESKFITRSIYKIAKKINNFSLNKIIFKKVGEQFGGNVKYFVSGGSKLIPEVAEDFYTFGIKICDGYGLTEMAPMISFTPQNHIVPGSSGKILPNLEVKILEDGEILAKGRNVMKGYYKNPEATSQMIDSDGYLHTGDLGYIKDDFLFINGRKKEMIVLSNGKNINPVEIENKILVDTNLIKEIAVTDINSVLTAVVYPDFQKMLDEKIVNIKEAIKWKVIDKYNRNVPDYKKILDICIVKNELPKTKIGKIRRFLLKDFIKSILEEEVEIEEPKYEEYSIIKDYLYNLKGRKINPKAHIELDLGIDSLDMVEFLGFINEKFGIMDNELIIKYPTVEELTNYLRENKKDVDENIKIETNNLDNIEIPSGNLLSKIFKPLLFVILKLYFRLDVKNKNETKNNPVIYVGNHQSYIDAPILNYTLKSSDLSNTYYIAKIDHFRSGLMKFIAKYSNVVVIDPTKDVSAYLKTCYKLLNENKNIVIFPEGARTRDGKLGEFKKSFALIAKELNINIKPFVIDGAYDAFPIDTKIPRPKKISIEFLDEIKVENLEVEEILKITREKILDKLKEEKE